MRFGAGLRKCIAQISIGLTTFLLGIFSFALLSPPLFHVAEESKITVLEVLSEPDSGWNSINTDLAFISVTPGCTRFRDGSGVSASDTFEVSDGTILKKITLSFESRTAAIQRFRSEMAQASTIIGRVTEVDSAKIVRRGVFERRNEFFVITLEGDPESHFRLEILQGAELRHVLSFEEQERSWLNDIRSRALVHPELQ